MPLRLDFSPLCRSIERYGSRRNQSCPHLPAWFLYNPDGQSSLCMNGLCKRAYSDLLTTPSLMLNSSFRVNDCQAAPFMPGQSTGHLGNTLEISAESTVQASEPSQIKQRQNADLALPSSAALQACTIRLSSLSNAISCRQWEIVTEAEGPYVFTPKLWIKKGGKENLKSFHLQVLMNFQERYRPWLTLSFFVFANSKRSLFPCPCTQTSALKFFYTGMRFKSM